MKNTEKMLLHHLSSSAHEEELTSLLADLTDLEEFETNGEGENIIPESFLKVTERKVALEKPHEKERFSEVRQIIVTEIQGRMKRSVAARDTLLVTICPSISLRSRTSSMSSTDGGVERTASQIRDRLEDDDAEGGRSDLHRHRPDNSPLTLPQ